MNNFIDRTGKRYGRLTVIKRGVSKDCHAAWLCSCDCGNTVTVNGNSLRRGAQSCGCLKRDFIVKRFTTHGKSKHPVYSVWQNIKNRCLNHKYHEWKYYGGRGLRMHEPWIHDFGAFYDYVSKLDGFEKREELRLTLDRIDNSQGYFPGNLRWATQSQQNKNQRKRQRTQFIDESGKRYGRLRVLTRTMPERVTAYWLCRCDCGAMTSVQGRCLRYGITQSCGCLGRERLMAGLADYRKEKRERNGRIERSKYWDWPKSNVG